jgi:predicted acetyltransferase
MTQDFRTAPIDEQAKAILAEKGYELRIVDPDDREAMERYVQAESRGFLGGTVPQAALDAQVEEFAQNRRNTAVYDPHGTDPRTPIATTNSWIGPLTLPGERDIDAWAISGVTVAQTHRRRGIQRQMMEAELRTAHGLDVPIAMLTVSESSIYGRYGFGVAALAAEYRITTRGLTWTGHRPDGRVDFIPARQWRDAVPALFERTRLRDPGQVRPFALRWDQAAGFVTHQGDKSAERQAIQYRDADGEIRGLAIYKINEGTSEEDFTTHEAQVIHLVAETDDAYAALWRFFVEMDLVSTIRYDLGSVDEPVRWMVSNFRAVEVRPFDMQYLRLLDVKRVLETRRYEVPGEVSFEVTDDLGFASGSWTARANLDGAAVVQTGGDAQLTLGVVELGAMLCGGTNARTLAAAGRVVERAEGAVQRAAAMLSSTRTPQISSWY